MTHTMSLSLSCLIPHHVLLTPLSFIPDTCRSSWVLALHTSTSLLTFSLFPEYLHPLPHAPSFLLLEAAPWSYDDPSSSLLALTGGATAPPAALSHLHGAGWDSVVHTPVISAAWCPVFP